MPNSKVLRAELAADGSLAVTVELSHLEPGEQALVQTTVTQPGAMAEATAFVTGAAPAGPQRAQLVVVPRSGNFTHDAPLVAFSQATTVWTTMLSAQPVDDRPDGSAGAPRWAAVDDGHPGVRD